MFRQKVWSYATYFSTFYRLKAIALPFMATGPLNPLVVLTYLERHVPVCATHGSGDGNVRVRVSRHRIWT